MPSEEVLGQITATTSTSTYQQTTEIATESEQNTINTEDRQSLRLPYLLNVIILVDLRLNFLDFNFLKNPKS